MSLAATFRGRSPKRRGTRLAAVGPPVRRVALGPSLSGCREGLQHRLGADWIVHDLISCDAPDGLDDVLVLGTEEIEPGSMQVSRRGLGRAVTDRDRPIPKIPRLERPSQSVRSCTPGRDAAQLGQPDSPRGGLT